MSFPLFFGYVTKDHFCLYTDVDVVDYCLIIFTSMLQHVGLRKICSLWEHVLKILLENCLMYLNKLKTKQMKPALLLIILVISLHCKFMKSNLVVDHVYVLHQSIFKYQLCSVVID